MSRLFQRSFKLTVDTVGISNDDGDGLDIEFKVEKNLKGEPNKAEIKIYNLNPDHRSEFLKKFGSQIQKSKRQPIRVELEAGYKDDRGIIFSGDLRNLVISHAGPDFVTTLSGADGGHAYRSARIAQTYGSGVAFATVAKECARAMGVGLGNLDEMVADATIESLGRSFSSGAVLHGAASDCLDRLMKAAKLTWTVHNGVLQIQNKGEPLQRQSYRLSPDTGLIGSPTPEVDTTVVPNASGKTPTKPSQSGLLKVKTLLIHHLYPGVKVVLDSEEFQGGYQITEVTYEGSTFSDDWFCDCKVRPY